MDIRPIRNEEDRRAALQEIERLWNAEPGTDDGDKLDILATLVERYEDTRWPVSKTRNDPIDMLHFLIDECGHTQAELGDLLGSSPRASEILNRKRALTVDDLQDQQGVEGAGGNPDQTISDDGGLAEDAKLKTEPRPSQTRRDRA